MRSLTCHYLLVLAGCAVLLVLNSCATPRSARPLPVAQLLYPVTAEHFGGELPEALAEYAKSWQGWMDEAPPHQSNPAVKDALPPSSSQLAFEVQRYTDTFPALLFAMASPGLTASQRKFLQTLSLLHQRQALLAGIYQALDELQHSRREALPALLEHTRLLQDFQRKFQRGLPRDAAAAVLEELSPWIALWEGRDPLGVLPNLWQATREMPALDDNTDKPPPAAAVRFTALYSERPANAQLPDDLRGAKYLWLRQDFETPVVAEGRLAYLILPALPRQAEIRLNDQLLQNPRPGHPWAIPLTAELLGDAKTQTILIQLPTSKVGNPVLPICLAAGE